jgi:hypothetical protein
VKQETDMPKIVDEGPRTGAKNYFYQMNRAEWVPYFHLKMELKPASEISFYKKKRKMENVQRMYICLLYREDSSSL